MGDDPAFLSVVFLSSACCNGGAEFFSAGTWVLILAYGHYSYGGMCFPGDLGIYHLPPLQNYGKSDDLLSGFLDSHLSGQRSIAYLYLPQDAYTGKQTAV